MTIHIDRLIRSRRKTLSLIVEQDGALIVRAPLHLSESRIREFVEEHAAWVQRKQSQVRASASPAKKEYSEGGMFLFLGRAYPLHIVPRQRPRLILKDGVFCMASTALPAAAETFIRWYRMQALQVISGMAASRAARHGFTYRRIRISSARTRWGSCSTSGTLSFTWRLVLAPEEAIDYVVVHELVHTKTRDHSKRFWEQVAAIVPDYKARVQWLKKNGAALAMD